ncbi:MAG: sortase [Candidatus Peribacteraceae bacterium]|nr:sortase [Candidatus Peribacteraceae bacterium]
MSLTHPHLNRACYDRDGNIVILPDDVIPMEPDVKELNDSEDSKDSKDMLIFAHTVKDEDCCTPWNAVSENVFVDQSKLAEVTADPDLIIQENPHPALHSISTHTHNWIEQTLSESKRQYQAVANQGVSSWQQTLKTFRQIPSQAQTFLVRSSAIASKPVTIGKRKRQKPRSKLTLFLIDTVRFGGTFALIFVTLFVGINYQSFWQIAKADLALGNDIQTQHALADIVGQRSLASPLTASHVSYQRDDGSLLAHLSPVGPPTNRIIIPSLGINAPIVEPKIDALVSQNWVQFEKDVQASLLQGVVHYPGSARPGQTGNVFLTGHSSFYFNVASNYKEIFATLGNIRVGDTYSLYHKGDLHQYRVIEKFEVSPNNVSVLDQPLDKRLSTLMTCTPVGTTLRRLIVRAEEIDPVTGEILKVGQRPSEQQVNPVMLDELPI